MADISNTATKISKDDFSDGPTSMIKRTDAYPKNHNGKTPAIVYTKAGGSDYVTYSRYQDMYKRYVTYHTANGRWPNYVTVNLNASTKTAFHLSVEAAVGTYNTFTEFYERIRAKTYLHYSNDQYNQTTELSRLKSGIGLNCVDFSQLGNAVAVDLGMEAKYIHVKCNKSGEGHIYLQVRGKELGTSFVNVDLAAAASDGSNYALGKTWCTANDGGTEISENDYWLLTDNGSTTS